MKFSERAGIQQIKTSIQLTDIDIDLKNGLWNILDALYIEKINKSSRTSSLTKNSSFVDFIDQLWFSHFKEPLDTIPYNISGVTANLRSRFFKFKWYEIYDFIEFIIKNPGPIDNDQFKNGIDFILKRELSGYRLIEDELTPIIDDNQVNQIQKAIDDTSENSLKSVNTHLKASLHKLSDKKNPDYRNSMKESISAVEAICQIISNDKKAELGKALKVIKTKIGLHTSLEQAFIKIYGYTSDGDGIRHSLSDESTVDQEDAIYMLTTCSAFINYLIIKADKAGISIN